MVDVSEKERIKRTAAAYGKINLTPSTVKLLKEKALPKGDVLTAAKIAGIQGGKKTSELIPLCHNISIGKIDINFKINDDSVEIFSVCTAVDKTGIEMEALTSVSIAALTVYDMCKAVDKNMSIGDIYLLSKEKRRL